MRFEMRTIGLIVNPVAGMGGSVGLKGTDGEMYAKALAMGAEPVSPARARDFLSHLSCRDQIRLLTAPGAMGALHAEAVGLGAETIGTLTAEPTREDTKTIARQMLDAVNEEIVEEVRSLWAQDTNKLQAANEAGFEPIEKVSAGGDS